DMSDDTGSILDPHVRKRESPMAPIVDHQAVFRMDHIEEVGAEADDDPDDATNRARRWKVDEVFGCEHRGLEVPQVVGRRDKDIGVARWFHPSHQGLWVFERETEF